jgi:hypothetical protein
MSEQINAVGASEASEALTSAAEILRSGGVVPAESLDLLADMLRAEAILLTSIEPFADLISVGIEQAGGGKAALRLAKNEATGELKFFGDNIPNALRLAKAIIKENNA